jgi:hypothetical protein
MTAHGEMIVNLEKCRVCQSRLDSVLIAFDGLPVAAAYVQPEDPLPDSVYPLTLLQCKVCGLVQLRESITPAFYRRYSFASGVADGYKRYLSQFAKHIAESLPAGAMVLEVGCNDGTLLQYLQDAQLTVAGFEPAQGPAAVAQRKGLAVINEYFNPETVEHCGFPRASSIVIRHVLEHIDEFDPIFTAIDQMVQPDTTLVIEVPDLTTAVHKSLFSNIYHIHPCYFGIETLSYLLKRHGWNTVGSTTVNIFGGSLVVWAQRATAAQHTELSFPNLSVAPARSVTNSELDEFVQKWRETAHITRKFFDDLRAQGKRIAGYGAAERTASLMGIAGLDRSHVEVLFDRNPHLVGKALSGNRIPILHPDALAEYKPDYLAIFAQSFEEEIIAQQAEYRISGGCFISFKSGQPQIIDC